MATTILSSALEPLLAKPSLSSLAEAAQGCMACDLYKNATQAVMGEGPPQAALFFVGEQPGDQEDLSGRPFVGPAGKVFDEALAEAGIAPEGGSGTNALTHFKCELPGNTPIH